MNHIPDISKTLIESLRELGLDLNAKKTDILKPYSVKKQLQDPREEDLTSIDRAIKTRHKETITTILPLLIDLFDKSFAGDDKFADRHLKFCINRFVRLIDLVTKENKENINKQILDNLAKWACATDLFSKFLRLSNSDIVKKELIKFLKSENNIYDWQEMRLLNSLLAFSNYGKSAINLFAKIAFDKNKHYMCRANAILLLGKFSNGHYKHELTRRFNTEENYIVRRAIIIAVQELNSAERNSFYNRVKSLTEEHNILIDYLKSRTKPIYFPELVESQIEIEEEPY